MSLAESNQSRRIAIVGAGLAGLVLADALARRGRAAEVVVFDRGGPRASQAPGATLNPLAGRSVAPKPGIFDAYDRAAAHLRRWRDELGASVLEAPMVRPLTPGAVGERLARSFEESKGLFPAGFTVRRAPADRFPLVGGADEVLTYEPTFSVDLPDLLERLRDDLARRGVGFVDADVEGIHRDGDRWSLEAAADGPFDTIVLAVGDAAATWVGGLELSRKAGELLVLEPPEGVTLDHLVGGHGHLAPLTDGRWIGGSTFYRYDGAFRDGGKSEADIRARLERLVPAVAHARTIEVWSGIRTVLHPTRAPVMGAVPDAPGLWFLGCLGPKGLLWSPSLAELLADALIAGAPDVAAPQGVEPAAELRVNPARVTSR